MRACIAFTLCALSALSTASGARAQADPETGAMVGPSPQLVDRIVAVVDREPILLSDVQLEMENYLFEARSAGAALPDDQAEVRREVLDRLIESKLLVAQAKREGLVIGDEELESAVGERMEELEQRFGGRATLERELGKSGMSYEDLRLRNREVTRNRLYSMRIVQAYIRPRVELMDNEVRQYFDEHRSELPKPPSTLELAAILLVPQPDAATAKRIDARLASVRAGLSAGQSFEDLAQQFSEGPNAARGGLVGTFARGDLFNRVLEKAAWELPVGEVSSPITTEIGVHLIRVDSRTDTELTLRQILFAIEITDADREEARQRALRVVELARGGRDFAELARNLSDDVQTREDGGRLGEVATEQLNPAIREAVDGLEPGEISEPAAGNEGYYVFKVLARSPQTEYSFDEVEGRLRNLLLNQRLEEELQRYLDELREDFYIEIKA